MTPTPWGHKQTIHVYVEGSIEDAMDVGDKLAACEIPPLRSGGGRHERA